MAEKKKRFTVQEIENILKKQKMVFAFLNNSTPKDASYKNYYLPLKELFGEVIIFDPARVAFSQGEKKMNSLFISLVEKENPDYIFIDARRDEIPIELLEEIREKSPKTKIISYTGDDDKDFEPVKRYHALFMDCTLIAQAHYLKRYYGDGVKNVIPTVTINTRVFKPMNLKKIYDVVFVGKASDERAETISYLIKNKVNLRVFGGLWNNYPDIKDFCGDHLSPDEMAKVINQTKINLGLSRNKYGQSAFKWRVFEISACKSFGLVDYFPEYYKFFKKNKEIIMFKDNEDLLKKIKYYLKNEKEREKIAENSYKRTIKDYDILRDFKNIFKKIIENPETFSQKLPEIKEKVITLKKEDLEKTDEEIKSLVKDYDYIAFSGGDSIPLKYKNYLQAYSLNKTKKQISCCDCYVYDKILGDYLTSNVVRAYDLLSSDNFSKALSINQLMFSKDYLVNNFDKFREFLSGQVSIIDTKNTTFISMPLVKIKRINKIDSETFSTFFHQKNFAFEIQLLSRQKRLFLSRYFYRLIYLSIINSQMRKYFIKIFDSKFMQK